MVGTGRAVRGDPKRRFGGSDFVVFRRCPFGELREGSEGARIASGGSREGSGRGSGSVSGRIQGGRRARFRYFCLTLAFFKKRAPAEAKTLFLKFRGFGKRVNFVQKSVRITQTVRKRGINDTRAFLGRLFGGLGCASGGRGSILGGAGAARGGPKMFKNRFWVCLGRVSGSQGQLKGRKSRFCEKCNPSQAKSGFLGAGKGSKTE